MPANRYGGFGEWVARERTGRVSDDWFSANAPDAPIMADPNAPGREQGGISGGAVPVAGAPPTGWGKAAPMPTAAASQGPEAFGNDYQAWFNSLIQGKPFNQQTLLNLEPVLKQYGMALTPPNAAGERTKIQLPSGEWVRVGFGEGHPVWIPQGAAGRPSGGPSDGVQGWQGGENFGAPPPPYQSQPWTGGEYTPPSLPSWLQRSYVAPTWNEQFAAPTMVQAMAEPGYQTRLATGQQALERSAAARGSLLGGGQQKALSRYGQEFGANEYGNVYGRALNEYLQKYGEFSDAATRGLQARQQNVGEFGTQVGLGQQTYANRYGAYMDDQARRRADYLQNYTVRRGAEQDLWSRYRDLYEGGLQGALGTRTPTPL